MFIENEKLVYRGEGNSSLVIALKNERKVIRLLKSEAKQLKDADNEYCLLKSNIGFVETTIGCLLSRQLFSVPKLIKLSETQIQRIHLLVQNKRPSHRLDKGISRSQFALLLPDYCCIPRTLSPVFGPNISVEIKPKQGFLPNEELLSDWLKVKSRVCRYCLSQFHKLKKGSITQLSGYCPLDLFSGCPQRQLKAIQALIESPQNNFRVFRDINYCFGDDLNQTLDQVLTEFATKEVFKQLLIKALNLKIGEKVQKNSQKTQQYCDLHSSQGHLCQCDVKEHELTDGSVLSEILSAQRLDTIDSELANQMMDSICVLANNNEDISRQLKSIPKYYNLKERAREETQKDYYLRKVWQFLVSLTAKDCSIMVSMQKLNADHVSDQSGHVIVVLDQSFLVSVFITDLDQKSWNKIKRTLNNDKRMVKAFKSSL